METISKKEVQNQFKIYQNQCGELKKYSLEFSDTRCGRHVALAINTNNSIFIKSELMTYNKFIYYLRGYYAKSTNKY